MNRVDHKIAVVTGSTQGLGAAIAMHFAKAGSQGIVICGRSQEKGESVAQQITSQTGCDVTFVKTNLEDIDDIRNLIAKAEQKYHRIDCLVNAAGMTDRGNLLNTSPDRFDRTFAVNVRAPFFLMQEACKVMIRKKIEGTIVNIGSIAAMAGQPFISAYCASKGALQTLTRNSGYALLRNRIRVNQLNIGWMASDGEDTIQRKYHGAKDGWQAEAGRTLPFGRLLDPDEVAKAALFLASADSGVMTGAIINFDQSVWGGCSFAPPTPDEPLQVEPGA